MPESAAGQILIFHAFAREVAPFRRLLSRIQPLPEGIAGCTGNFAGARVAMIASGMGTLRAQQAARRVFRSFPSPKLVISTGVAGALIHDLRPGDVILANRLLLGGRKSARPDHILESSAEGLRLAEHALNSRYLPYRLGALLTSSKVLADAPAKRSAADESGAIAVDMESAAIALEAAASGARFICVRTILDRVDDDLFGGEMVDDKGVVSARAAAGFFTRNPTALLKIPRVIRSLSAATRALGAVLEALCQSTLEPT